MTRASIVIPSRGGAARLPLLLSTLAAQTHPDWEAIVVLDGDIDDSAAVVAEFADHRVRVIVFEENRGRVAALNAGFEAATGDVLIRADDDFELNPGHIAAHVGPHERGRCGVVGLPLNVARPTTYMRAYGIRADADGRRAARATAPEDRWRLWGGNVSCTRETYDQLGGYDPRYQGYGWEDLDFGYRLMRQGIPIHLVEEANVRHHLASVTTRIRAQRAFDSGSARGVFESIHGPGASGPAEPVDGGLWNRAVRGLAGRGDRRRVARAAKIVDAAIHLLPPPLSRKAIALVVESAAVAGFRAQRHREDDA